MCFLKFSAEGCSFYSPVTALGYAWGWAHHIGVQLSHFYVFTWLNIKYLQSSNSCLRLMIRDLCALSWHVQWFKINSEARSQALHVSRGSGTTPEYAMHCESVSVQFLTVCNWLSCAMICSLQPRGTTFESLHYNAAHGQSNKWSCNWRHHI